MELNLIKKPVSSLVEALNKVSEQPVDIDFTLPDYCPDIEKILRCRITPKIYNRNLSGGQLQIEGASVVSVLYEESEKGTVRACEQTVPFSADFRAGDIKEDYIVETNVKTEYVNCRAMSRRRLTIHGAFSLYVKLYTKGDTDLCAVDDIDNVEFKTSEVTLSALKALAGEQFSVADEIQITGKPPVELILESDVKARVTDCRIIPDKLMLNGELSVRALYVSDIESGKLLRFDYIVPFSEIIDCVGLDENTTACVNLSVLSYDLSLKSDILSENPLVNFDARLSVCVTGYAPETVTIAKDAYSTEFYSEPVFTRVSVPTQTVNLSDTFMKKDSLALDDCGITEILDFTAELSPVSADICDGKLTLTSKVGFNILAINTDDEPVYIERFSDLREEVPLNDELTDVLCAEMSIVSVSYRLGDNNTIETRCEVKYGATLQKLSRVDTVCSINIDENRRLPRKNCALTLYYAQTGEKIWDIAKEYNTKESLIIAENNLSAEELEQPLMLLIPTV